MDSKREEENTKWHDPKIGHLRINTVLKIFDPVLYEFQNTDLLDYSPDYEILFWSISGDPSMNEWKISFTDCFQFRME